MGREGRRRKRGATPHDRQRYGTLPPPLSSKSWSWGFVSIHEHDLYFNNFCALYLLSQGVFRVGIGSARNSGNLSTSAPDLAEAAAAAANIGETGGDDSREAKGRSNLLASQLAQVHEARKLLCNDAQPMEQLRDPRKLLDSGYDELTELEKEIGEILQDDEDEEVVEEERHQGTDSCTDDDMDLTSGLITLESLMGNAQREALGDSRGQLLAKVQRPTARDDPIARAGAPAEGAVAGDAAAAPKPRVKEKMTSRINALFRRMIDSEAVYLRDLDILIRAFITPLRESQVLDRKMTMEIVSTAEFIHKVNSDMMKQFASVHNDLARSGPNAFLAMVRACVCPSFTGRDVVTHSELVGVAHTDTVVQAVLHVLRQLRTVLLGHLAR